MIRQLAIGILTAMLFAACSSTPGRSKEGEQGSTQQNATMGNDQVVSSTTAPQGTASAANPDNPGNHAVALSSASTGTGGTGAGNGRQSTDAVPGAGLSWTPENPPANRIVYFAYDNSRIQNEFKPLLRANAAYLMAHQNVNIVLQGNTDERGSREYNLALGQRRSQGVLQALELMGVPDNRMEAVSFGAEKPIAPGHDETVWKLNRRTEIAYPNQ
jgi:peptidoglycan-associated lipoprotein